MDDLLPTALGLGLTTTMFLGVLFGTIRLTRRRRMRPLLATMLMAVAAAALPWIIRAVGGRWSSDSGVVFSALMAGLVIVGTLRPYRDLYSRDIRER